MALKRNAAVMKDRLKSETSLPRIPSLANRSSWLLMLASIALSRAFQSASLPPSRRIPAFGRFLPPFHAAPADEGHERCGNRLHRNNNNNWNGFSTPPRNLTVVSNGLAANDSDVMDWSDLMRIGWDSPLVDASSYADSDLQAHDWAQIEEYWDDLLPAVSYLGTVRVSKIYKALCVAYHAHREQKRKSGEPFIVHVRERTVGGDGVLTNILGFFLLFSRWKSHCF